jgi:hypothetical protein
MIVGVSKEIKDQEYRVALLPSVAYQLIETGESPVPPFCALCAFSRLKSGS